MKKTSLLLQRPTRTFDEDEVPKVLHGALEPSPAVASPMSRRPVEETRAGQGGMPQAKVRSPEASGAASKFGPITVDLAKAKKRVPKGLLTTSVPSLLHSRLMQQEEGPSGFINNAVMKYLRADLNKVVEAGYRLAELRAAAAEGSQTISARIAMTHVADADEAARYVTRSLEKVSASFIVGGCVMLLAEEMGLV